MSLFPLHLSRRSLRLCMSFQDKTRVTSCLAVCLGFSMSDSARRQVMAPRTSSSRSADHRRDAAVSMKGVCSLSPLCLWFLAPLGFVPLAQTMPRGSPPHCFFSFRSAMAMVPDLPERNYPQDGEEQSENTQGKKKSKGSGAR